MEKSSVSGSSEDLPSAWETLAGVAGKPVAIFCDYDGTLTSIVSDPSLALLSGTVRRSLARIAQCRILAIVSGRDLSEVRALVDLDGVIYAGSHGFEIEGPGVERFEHPSLAGLPADLGSVQEVLRRDLASLPGVLLQRKRYSVAVHTRTSRSERERDEARSIAEAAVATRPRLRLQEGKEVLELRPDVDWDKGRAVSYVLDALGPSPIPLYLGDDRTDEDAFAVVRARYGWAILVGDSEETAATHTLSQTGVESFLEALADVVCA